MFFPLHSETAAQISLMQTSDDSEDMKHSVMKCKHICCGCGEEGRVSPVMLITECSKRNANIAPHESNIKRAALLVCWISHC